MSRIHKINAFVIKRINYSEADKILTVYSLENGKQTLIAKGIRRIKSRRAGSLELFSQAKIVYYQGRSMGIVTETELIKPNYLLSQNYLTALIAYQMIELIDKLTLEDQLHPELYYLLEKALNYLQLANLDQNNFAKVMIRFRIRILEELGFGVPENPDLASLTRHIESILEKELTVPKMLPI
jgi:DNA repair protein RecO (recombination protein O)